MENNPSTTVRCTEIGRPRSAYAAKLASNPELRARHERAVARLREAAADEIKAIEDSERLTGEDLSRRVGGRALPTVPDQRRADGNLESQD